MLSGSRTAHAGPGRRRCGTASAAENPSRLRTENPGFRITIRACRSCTPPQPTRTRAQAAHGPRRRRRKPQAAAGKQPPTPPPERTAGVAARRRRLAAILAGARRPASPCLRPHDILRPPAPARRSPPARPPGTPAPARCRPGHKARLKSSPQHGPGPPAPSSPGAGAGPGMPPSPAPLDGNAGPA